MLTGAEGQRGDAGEQVAQAHVVALPRRRVAQQPVAPPHRLRRLCLQQYSSTRSAIALEERLP